MSQTSTASVLQRLRGRVAALPWGRKAEADTSIPTRVAGHGRSMHNAKHYSIASTGIDNALICVIVALLLWGMVMVYSASIALGDNPGRNHFGPYAYLIRHVFALVAATVAAVLAFQVKIDVWQKWSGPLILFALFLLLLVLVPGIGKGVNGARRWIPVGIMNFQPSELAKFALVIYGADYIRRKMENQERDRETGEVKRFIQAVWPMMLVTGGAGLLLMMEPDMGAFMVLAVIAVGIMFLGGVNAKMTIGIVMMMVMAFALVIFTSPWRRERVLAYLDPWSTEHALGKGYQLSHALIAIGRGKLTGVGLGGSVEKLHWLPEAHTDFLFSVIGEEWGFIGVLVLLVLFYWLVRRITEIGRQAIKLDRVFAGLVAQGVAIWMGFQAFINIGVNLGALPTKGLTLPLMSYGGSAILMNLVALAVVLRIDYENRILMKGGTL